MTKNYFVKLCVLIVVAAMMLSLFACDIPGVDPEITTTGTEQSTTEETTKAEETTTKGEVTTTEGEATTTEGEATTTEGEATTTEGEATTTKGEVTTTEGEATTTKGEVTTTKAEETTTKGEVTTTEGEATTTKGEVTTTKAEETTTKVEETSTKAEETSTKAEETSTKAEETTTKAEETTTTAEETTTVEETTIEEYTGEDADTREVAKIILIGGQSNAEGCAWGDFLTGNFEADRIAKFTNGFSNVTIFARNSDASINTNGDHRGVAVGGVAPVKVSDATGDYRRTFGPEVGLAEYLEEKYPGEKFYIMKYAVGGSMLGVDWIVGETKEQNGLLLQAFEKKLQNSLTYVDEVLNLRPEIIAFCWMQGEGDAQPGWYEYYYERQLALMDYIRREYSYYSPKNGIAFIDAGISDARHNMTGNYYWPKYVEINQTKKDLAARSKMNYYIDTIGAGMSTYEDNTDYAHYGVKSMILLGRLFGECVEDVLKDYSRGLRDPKSEPVFPTAPTDDKNAILELDYNKIYNDGFRNNKNHTATLEDGYVHIAFNATGSVWLADPDPNAGKIPADKFVQYKWGARYLVIKYRATEEIQGYFYANPSREAQVGWEMLHFTLEGGNGVDWQYKVFDLYDNAVFKQFGPYLASFAVLFSGSIDDNKNNIYYTRPEGATLDIAYMNFYSFEHGIDCVEWTYDENGHSRTACPDCGKEALNNAPHNYTSIDQTTNEHVCECGYRLACSEWTYDENGHSHPACAACGTENIENEPHKFTTYNAERNAHLCECGYGIAGITLNDSVSHIARPDTMMEYSGYNVLSDIKVENGVIYRSQTGHVASADNGGYAFGLKINDDDIHVIGARYIVIKLRTNVPVNNFHSWQLHFNGGSGNIGLASTAFTTGEWTTLVIDMSNYGHSYYKPGENGAYPEFSQFLLLPWASKGDYTQYTLDIAYIATVKDEAGVIALVGDDTIVLQAQAGSAAEITADAFCARSHAYVDNGDGTHNTPACERCGLVSEKVNHTYVYNEDTNTHDCVCGAIDNTGHSCTDNGNGTHTVASCTHCGIDGVTEEHRHAYDEASAKYACVCGNSVGKTFAEGVDYLVLPHEFINQNPGGNATIDNGIKVDEDGTVYRQILLTSAATSNFLNVKVTKGSNIQVGRYLVYKIRTDAPNPNDDTKLRFAMHDGSGHKYHTMPDASIFTGDWAVVIVDLEAVYTNYKLGDDGKYPWMTADTLLVAWGRPAMAGYTIDLAYLAIVDSLEDVMTLVDGEIDINLSTATETATKTSKMELCSMAGNHIYTINTDGTHTTPSCDKCGLVGGATEAHNYTHDGSGNFTCICGNTVNIDGYQVYDKALFPHFTPITGPHTEGDVTYYSAVNASMCLIARTDKNIVASDAASYLASKYLAFKIRTDAIDATSDKKITLKMKVGGVEKEIALTPAGVEATEWVTYIVDISSIASGYNTNDTYVNFQLNFNGLNTSAGKKFDIAYFVADANLKDVLALVDTNYVQYYDGSKTTTYTDSNIGELKSIAALGQTAE